MQTFLPYSDFEQSARVLDRQRLGKQRVETMQIMNVLAGLSDGWKNHPAVKMWRGYEVALFNYQDAIINEWNARGYKDLVCFNNTIAALVEMDSPGEGKPNWLGDERFHSSHRSNLLRKNPTWYGRFGWEEPDSIPYYWPPEKKDDS